MAGYQGPKPDPTMVIRPKHSSSSSALTIAVLLICAASGLGAFWLMAGKAERASAACADTVYDIPVSSASTVSTVQCPPQHHADISIASDGRKVIVCRCAKQ